MKNILFKYCAILLVTITGLQAQVTLQYNLKKGEQYKVFQKADQDIIQDMNGSEHKMKNDIEAEYIFIVKDVSDSLFTIDFKFNSFKMISSSNLMGELMSVNTKDSIADDDIEGKIFSGLTKSFLTMKMYKNGKVKDITGTETLIDHMISGAGDFDSFTKELMKEAMKNEFGGESLGNSFEQMTFIYANKPVKINDTWQNKFSGELSADNTWTFVKSDDEDIELSAKSDITFNSDDESITMKLSGSMDTKVFTDPESKFITSMKAESRAEGISILKQASNLEVPTTVITNTSYKVEKYVQ